MQNVTNCGDENQIITNLNSSTSVTDNCEMASTSCSSLKPYNKTELTIQAFDYRSDMMISELKFDFCDKKKKSDLIKLILLGFGVPVQCSSKKSTVFCYNPSKPMLISQSLQKMLPIFARNIKVRIAVRMNHDTGTSCMNALSVFKDNSKA